MSTQNPTGDAISRATTSLQSVIERIILYSRFILIVFYVGLAVALVIFAIAFGVKLYETALHAMAYDETEMLLAMLVLIDKSLVAGLIVMVMLSSYENFVGRFEDGLKEDSPAWLGRLDPGNLKIKVAAAIVAISSVHLLQVFMNMKAFTEVEILWKSIIHMIFIGSAISLGLLDRLSYWGAGQGHHDSANAKAHGE